MNCQRLRYNKENNEFVLLGIILSEDDFFIEFKTAKKTYRISKKSIVEIEPTEIEFREGDDNGRI